MIPHPPRRRLARRLLTANVLVILAGSVTLGVVALLVSPSLFHLHVGRALGPISESVARHLDQALSTALLVALGIGTAAAVVTALAVSWVLSSRLARPIEELSRTAERLARGDLTARAVTPSVDDELADLTVTFNTLATGLEHTEDTRRRLLSDLAHELRTPLSTVEGYLEGLRDGVVKPDEDTWATLQDAAERLRRLVDDVALVSRAEEGQLGLERHDLASDVLILDAVAAARDGFNRDGIVLECFLAPDLPRVRVDGDRIHQVIANLLSNARRHTSAGGKVTVAARRRGRHVVITVTDTGTGIDPVDLPHVFERFYRADTSRRSGSGSGIGLTIARAIATAHDGDLVASSDGPDTGSRFTLRLPEDAGADETPVLPAARRRTQAR